MKRLELNVDELNEFRSNESLLYAKDSTREMRITCYGSIQIFHKGVLVSETIQPFKAVEYFNNIKD